MKSQKQVTQNEILRLVIYYNIMGYGIILTHRHCNEYYNAGVFGYNGGIEINSDKSLVFLNSQRLKKEIDLYATSCEYWGI